MAADDVIKEAEPRAPRSQHAQKVETQAATDAIGATVSVEIDGKKVRVSFGTTILEAAKQSVRTNCAVKLPIKQ